MRVLLSEESIEVPLARWQKVLGLMKSIAVPIADISDVRLVEDPFAEIKGTGLKAGLRLPRLYYVARTVGLDRAFVVQRGVPAIAFTVRNHEPLTQVLASSPDAKEIAGRLQSL